MGENTNMTMEQGPVTFERPLKKKESRKQKEINSIITWFVRGAAFLAEVLFVLPLCVVSCSTQPKGDKKVNGFSASFGFKLSYLEEPVVGIWWFVIVFFLTALIIILWYAKDMNRLKDLKLRKMMLCFLTGVMAVFNVIIICCFIGVVNARVASANEGFAIGEVSVRYTLEFWILLIIQVLLSVGGIFATVKLYCKKYVVHKSKQKRHGVN